MSRINTLNEFLKTNPNDCFLHHALALELIKEGNENEAQQHFEFNLKTDETYLPTYYHLGKLYERTHNISSAIAVFSKGMHWAKIQKDQHSYNELMAAFEDLED